MEKIRARAPGRLAPRRIDWKNKRTYAGIVWWLLRFCIFAGLCFLILYPFLVKLSSCFMSYDDLINPVVKLFPQEGSLDYLRQAIAGLQYWETLLPTTLMSALVGVCQVFVACLTGYGLARFRFRGRRIWFLVIILTLLVPPQVLMIPLYVRFAHFNLLFVEFNLLNTYWPFVLLTLTGQGLKSGLYIFMMRQFFKGMPVELEESAYIDGAGPYRTFWNIMLPNARNMMLTIFLFAFSWQWTDSNLTPMYLPEMPLFSNTVNSLLNTGLINPIELSTLKNIGMLLIILPLLIIFVVLQKYIVEGVESAGIVG